MDDQEVSTALSSIAPALMSGISAAASSGAKPTFDLSDGLDMGDMMAIFGGGASQSGGDIKGTIPDGLTAADLVPDPPPGPTVDEKLRAKGWTPRRYGVTTRRYWFNFWSKTYVYTTTYVMTNSAGHKVEFTYTVDLGLTFWEDNL